MIVRETSSKYIFTKQHDHARVSGVIAEQFQHFFETGTRLTDAIRAVYEHDRSWITPDRNPLWNAETNRPYDFTDYPTKLKLYYYDKGLAETEAFNLYAALLCSKHYTSFIDSDSKDSTEQAFLISESERQDRLRGLLSFPKESILKQHYELLKLCDAISLYICLNEPGATKEQEHRFYKEGLSNSESFNPKEHGKLMGNWVSTSEIRISPNPFKTPFEVTVPQKHIAKETIFKMGFTKAYQGTDEVELTVQFV